jgi:signal transduction histidine kinase
MDPMPREGVARILVVDDSPANLVAMEALLAPLGQEVILAHSGEEAVRHVLLRDFAVVLLDVQMPGMDGYATAEIMRSRERTRDLPIIFMTGVYRDVEYERKAYALGAVDYVTKPIDIQALRNRIEFLLSVYRRARRTERLLAARGVEAARVREAERSRLKDMFLGILGHDLRNPLNAILMSADLLAEASDLPERHRPTAERILRSAHRMEHLIREVLDLTRGQLGGGIPVTRTSCDLAALCRQVADECEAAHPDRKIRFESRGEELRGEWDPSRLQQAITNLVANAIQYSSRDPVLVVASDEGDHAEIEVINHGTPIPEGAQRALFEPFRRGAEGHGGLGLGLYIVSEIVRAHEGSVSVSSTEEGLTTFTVRLPRLAPLHAEPRPSPAPHP